MTGGRLKVVSALAMVSIGLVLTACSGTSPDDASNADAGLHVGAGGASGAGGAQAGVGGVAGTGAGGVEGGTIIAAHCSGAGVCSDGSDARTDADAGEACVPGQVWKSTSDRVEITYSDGHGGYNQYRNDRASMTPKQIALLDALCVVTTPLPRVNDSRTYLIKVVDADLSAVTYRASWDDMLDTSNIGYYPGASNVSWRTWAPFTETYTCMTTWETRGFGDPDAGVASADPGCLNGLVVDCCRPQSFKVTITDLGVYEVALVDVAPAGKTIGIKIFDPLGMTELAASAPDSASVSYDFATAGTYVIGLEVTAGADCNDDGGWCGANAGLGFRKVSDGGVGPSVDAGGGEHIWAAGYQRFGVETRYQGSVVFSDGGNVYMSLLYDAASRELTAHGVLCNGMRLDGTARLSDAETSSLVRQLESVTTVDADPKCSFSDGDGRRINVVDAHGEVHDYPDRAWTCNGYSAGPTRPTEPCIDADLIPINKLIDLVADCTCPDAGAAAAPSVCVGNTGCSAH